MNWSEALQYLLDNPNGMVKDSHNNVLGWKSGKLVELTSTCYRTPEIFKKDKFIVVSE